MVNETIHSLVNHIRIANNKTNKNPIMRHKTALQIAAGCSVLLAQASYGATAELTQSRSNCIVKVDGTRTLSTTNYAAALQNAVGTGNRVMNIRAGGI